MMGAMNGELSQKAARAIISTARLLSHLQDEFFVRRVEQYLLKFIQDLFARTPSPRIIFDDCIRIEELLEELIHIRQLQGLSARIAIHSLVQMQIATHSLMIQETKSEQSASTREPSLKKKNIRREVQTRTLDGNQRKIFEFIQNFPSVRAKDLMTQFSVLSERTVQRNLKNLIQEGLVIREIKDHIIFYAPAVRGS